MAESTPGSILVTGATGLVGSAVVRAIRSAGFDGEIRAGARRQAALPEGCVPVKFDFDDLASVRTAVTGVDTLFLATGYSVDMLVHSKNVLDAAKEAGVRRIVHLGALSSGEEQLAPLVWHQYVERYIEALNFDFVHIRPNFFMETVIRNVHKAKGKLYHFFGAARVSFVSVSDIAEVAAASLITSDGRIQKIYPLASDPRTLSDVASILSSSWGREIECIPCPSDKLLPVLMKNGMEPCYAAGLADQMAAVAHGIWPLADSVFNTVEEVLARSPRHWADVARSETLSV